MENLSASSLWRALAFGLGQGFAETEGDAASRVRAQALVMAVILARVFRLRDLDSGDMIADESVMRLAERAAQGTIDQRRGNATQLLWGITQNVAREHARAQRRDDKRARRLNEVGPGAKNTADADLALKLEDMWAAVDELGAEERELLDRRFGVGQSEWSPVDSVRLHRLLKKLRQRLG